MSLLLPQQVLLPWNFMARSRDVVNGRNSPSTARNLPVLRS